MNAKVKILGVGMLVAALLSVAAAGTSASVTGHFTHDAIGTAKITGIESGTHRLKHSSDGGTPTQCDKVHYHGTAAASTLTTLDLTVTASDCHTEGAAPGTITIDSNNCHIRLHSNTAASSHTPTQHATVGIICPAGVNGIVKTHPNCTSRTPPQALKGVTYTTITENGKHKLTVNFTVHNVTTHYESGICVFLGTVHSGTTIGSITLEALNQSNETVNLTAT